MLDFWMDLPWCLRLGVAAVVVALGVGAFLIGMFRIGFILVGVGCVLILVGGQSEAEKKGYRF